MDEGLRSGKDYAASMGTQDWVWVEQVSLFGVCGFEFRVSGLRFRKRAPQP